MADNVHYLDVTTRLDIPPERVISGAVDAKLNEIVVIGFDENGEFYFASNKADGGDVLWLLEKAKKLLLEY